MPRRKMPLLTVRDFRARFSTLTEPVQVIRARGNVEILGTWTPTKRVTDRTGVRYPDEKADNEHPERSGDKRGSSTS